MRDNFRPALECAALLAFTSFVTMGVAAGCAELSSTEEDTGPVTTIGCANNLTPDNSILDWQLEVVPDRIVSGESFSADLGGTARFDESFLVEGCNLFPRGCEVVNLIELNATVQVRSGASGADVTLTVDEERYPYECREGGAACDPQNDLDGTPGARPNTDCQPESVLNPCGRFVRIPTSTECGPEGFCAERGEDSAVPGSQCDRNDFCITGDLEIDLAEATERYTAATDEEEVRFGWAEGESTGATLRESGQDEGTWILPEAVPTEPTGPLGLRISIAGIPVALECTMAVDCKGPLSNTDCLNFFTSPTPSFALISFPIESPP